MLSRFGHRTGWTLVFVGSRGLWILVASALAGDSDLLFNTLPAGFPILELATFRIVAMSWEVMSGLLGVEC